MEIRHHIRTAIWGIISLLTFMSCHYDPVPESEIELVVEGWIAEGQFPIVFVTSTLPIKKQNTYLDSLGQFVAQWARVEVQTDNDTVVLTGMYNSKYFPPYIFTSNRMRGVSGKRYRLIVDWSGLHAEATTSIPSFVPLDSLWTEPVSDNDTLRQLCAGFFDASPQHDHYLLFSRRISDYLNPQLCIFGLLDDAVVDSGSESKQMYTLHLRRGHQLDTDQDYVPYYSIGDTVLVTLEHVDSISFAFWRTFEDNRILSGYHFLPIANPLKGNIQGGHGVWYGCTQSTRSIVIL